MIIPRNIRSIQFMRFVAAALVVVVHLVLDLEQYYGARIPHLALYLAGFGAVGVHIFFVISGFVMAYTSFAGPMRHFSPANFLARRALRIYPVYWVFAALYLMCRDQFGFGYDLSLSQVAASFLLLPGYSSAIVGQGWTLSFEFFFYVCFACAMTLGLRSGLLVLTAAFPALIAMGLLLTGEAKQSQAAQVFTSALLLEFLLGAWVGYLALAGLRVSRTSANALVVLGLTGFAAGLLYGYDRLPPTVAWGIPSALLIAGMVFNEMEGRECVLTRRWWWLGDSSYSLYLLHGLFVEYGAAGLALIYPVADARAWLWLAALAILISCVAAGVVVYRLIERPLVAALQSMAYPPPASAMCLPKRGQ